MKSAQYEPINNDHLSEAAELLARQNQWLLQKFPLLPARIGDPEVTLAFLQSLMEKPDCHGMVQVTGSQIQTFMVGYYQENPFFGHHSWVPFGGMAFARKKAYDTFRAIYAAAGDQWMTDGVFNHYLVCPAIPGWLQAGYSLTFGQEQAYAVTSLTQHQVVPALPDGLTMRAVLPKDASQLFIKGHWIAAHLNRAPVWEPVPQAHLENILPEYAKLATDTESTTWVVLNSNEIVAYVAIYMVDNGPEYLMGIPTAAHFAAAAVHPSYRSRGVGRALFNRIIEIARQQHYQIMFTDWRTTNLQAANYWPTFGFEPFAYRLLRRVNPGYQPYNP